MEFTQKWTYPEVFKLHGFHATQRFYITQRFYGIIQLTNRINRLINGGINRSINGISLLSNGINLLIHGINRLIDNIFRLIHVCGPGRDPKAAASMN